MYNIRPMFQTQWQGGGGHSQRQPAQVWLASISDSFACSYSDGPQHLGPRHVSLMLAGSATHDESHTTQQNHILSIWYSSYCGCYKECSDFILSCFVLIDRWVISVVEWVVRAVMTAIRQSVSYINYTIVLSN